MNKLKTLKELSEYYIKHDIPLDIGEKIEAELGIELKASYDNQLLKNPIIVAPGQLTLNISQIEKIYLAGYSGCVLKSVIGEDKEGFCSMSSQRKKPTRIETFYEKKDKEGIKPIIHWDGRCDTRCLKDYLKFAKSVKEKKFFDFVTVGSLLCHLPKGKEEFKAEEWVYTATSLYNLGYKILEIDFCPYLKSDNCYDEKETLLRWYEEVPKIIKTRLPEVKIYPKLINPQFGLNFQIKMAEKSLSAEADGLVIGNRIYKEEYKSGHGGEELRLLNLEQIRAVKKIFPEVKISATGGVYSGRDILEYLKAGADNVQLLSYIMGKVKKPFEKEGNKLEKVFHKLLFDLQEGLLACMIKEGYDKIEEI